ncbi:1-acyl-sn-glycerol-3-phosphate acyltransferase epsilon-like [Diadema setosum]|uniref:1-acyl-sn-glycerol-3-phosphate acyltransferase epsilon-like n=1 Tax=Diadema setosum TaxID=31175 RepID=UPI003B3BC080
MFTVILHLNSLRYVVPAAMMMGCAPTYLRAYFGCHALSYVLPVRWYRAVEDTVWATYQRLVEFFFEHYSGVEVILYGEAEDCLSKKENVVYVSNHQTTLDWVVTDMLAARAGCLGRIRYILKSGLKFLPLYGYVFGLHGSIFVNRGKKGTPPSFTKVSKQLKSLRDHKIPVWMVVFPEGTRFRPDKAEVIKASQGFAYGQDLPVLHHVLSPRVRATHLCVEGFRGYVDTLYDVTIAYSNTGEQGEGQVKRREAPSMPDFLMGKCPRIHIHMRRIAVDSIPSDIVDFQRWLHGVFAEKDRMLADFYSEDPDKRGHLEGKGRRSRLGLGTTFPAFAVSMLSMVPFVMLSSQRQAYWKLWVYGSLFTVIWMKLMT